MLSHAELAGERGKGIWTTGEIHVQMQELDGCIYFCQLTEDNGPPVIDAASYLGPKLVPGAHGERARPTPWQTT